MKNIYFIQANDVYGTDKKSVYIPYAVGCIQTYCLTSDIVKSNYNFGKFIYTKEPVCDVISKLKDPYMVLFSCSVWNMEYNKTVAAEIKKIYPRCLITFGGHNVSATGEEISKYGFVDFVTHRFGEEPTKELLEALALGTDLNNVANISFKDEKGTVVTTKNEPQTSDSYPSPYLEGTFDEILKDDISFSALFESNRGCPNSCAFCDWSSLKSKVRLFSMERVKAELDWFVEHKIEYIYCIDANFCLFDRDAEIADYVVSCKEKYGYPQIFKVFFTKNRFNFVFDVSTKFFRSGLDKAKTVSFQSMDPQVLINVGRKNISADFFKELIKKYNELNISTFSELILGLPGETYESFCKGVSSLIENGQHYAINIYPCELLPNSQMGQKEYKEKFGIRSTRIPFKLIHSNDTEDNSQITEYSEYITSTYSMNEEDWTRSLVFSYYIQGLHNLGLLRAVAMYCCNENKISYADFYNLLLSYCNARPETLCGKVYKKIKNLCSGVIEGKNELVATCEGTEKILWGFDELLYLEYYKALPDFYKEIKEFVTAQFGKDEVTDALFDYQYNIVKKISLTDITIESSYDFYSYFSALFANEYTPLQKNKIQLKIHDGSPVNSLIDFAREVVWYGRNRRATDYTSSNYNVDYKIK